MAGSSSSINTASFKSVSIDKNLADFCECVKNLKVHFEDTGIPIDDDNIQFHRMCQKLEFLLGAGLREKSGVFGFKAKTSWHYLCTCLAKSKKVHEGVRFVRSHPELKTPGGKLRTLLRFCLVHQCLADTLQQCVVFEDITKEFYTTNSPLLKPGLLSTWISSLYDLSDLQYDLSPTGYDLDVGWPTFARKQFGNNTWKTPSSVGGLSSSFLSSYDSQSVTSFRSGLLISSSPLPDHPDGQASSVVSMAGHSSDNEDSLPSSPINSPTDMDNIQLLMDTVRQLTSDKEELQAQVDSLSQQLQQEKENGKTLERRLQETIDKQVSPIQVESLRQGEALARKMLAVRDGEVELLKAQMVSTEAKVDALKERHQLQRLLVMEEVRKMANQVASAEFQLNKWKEMAENCISLEHPDDVCYKDLPDGARDLADRLKHLLEERHQTTKEMSEVKEANVDLLKALAQHGQRLSTVTNELDQTWVWLSKLKLEASRLQTDESVMRIELKEKRQLLNGLKEQLESSRLQWERIRGHNAANQEQWQSIRNELDGRRTAQPNSEEPPSPTFDIVPDIVPAVQATSPVDSREERLCLMEQQCRSLYAKLAKTTDRNAALVSRLASLHQHYESSSAKAHQATAAPPVEAVQREEAEVSVKQAECDVQQLLSEKEMQIKALQEELKAAKFDRATKELERERENQAFQQQQHQLTEALERLKDNETLIRSLQDQLGAISNRTREERGELDAQLRQLQLSLMTRNEECEGFVNELRSTVAEMDQLRTQYQKAEEALEFSQTIESKLRAEGKMLQDESLMLRDKIIQLIKEKDCLWQRSDRLLHLQRVQAAGQWVDDGTIRDCQGCRTRFTLFVRRHHCRLCGRIFCHSCSDHWLKIASSSRPTRTCLECYAIHRQFSQPEAGQLNSIALPLADGPAVPMATNATTEFALITDVEIVQSLNESTYSNSPHDAIKDIRTAETRSFDSLIQNDAVVYSDTFVSAAMIYRVPLQVTKPGCSLHWKFKTDPKSIAFAVVGSEEPIDDEKQHLDDSMLTHVVVETTLHKSEVDFVEGSAILDHAGRYYVYFDNSYSRFSANKVTFHLSLSLPPATTADLPDDDD